MLRDTSILYLQGTDKSAVDAEAELQRNLARKLGMAKKKQKDSPDIDLHGKALFPDEHLLSTMPVLSIAIKLSGFWDAPSD